jgi:quercetin dioxygenase-like cupin family protein
MAISHAKPGESISVRPFGSALSETKTSTLIKTDRLEVIRLVVPAGKEIPTHRTTGEITVQCLEGRVAFTAGDVTRDLEAGHLLYLSGGQPHSLRGVENASVLITILLH